MMPPASLVDDQVSGEIRQKTTQRQQNSSAYEPSYNPIPYRADIDGLRAIAVLAVIGFHAFPRLIRGGFVGVDIFFVISGFLISGIIFAELDKNCFSFAGFYGRRIRRIFPALILVLVVVFALGWCILLPNEFRQLGKHIVGAAVFVSNFVLLRESGYFDTAAVTKPLLHLWSLGVEEQFYIIWPALVWLAWRRKIDFLALVLLISISSFVLCLDAPSRAVAFYSPVTRFWELMSGSALAFSFSGRESKVLNARDWLKAHIKIPVLIHRHRSDVISIVGLFFITIAIVITPAHHFPGVWALFPVVGSCLLISAGNSAWINRRILSNSNLVKLGLISYPLYLWHWPLLSYAWIFYGNTPPMAVRLAAVAGSLVLAYLTYMIVERPIRFGSYRNHKTTILCGTLILVGCAGVVTNLSGGLPSRPVAKLNQAIAQDLVVPTGSRTSDLSCAKLLNITPAKNETCIANSAHPDFLIIGDSQAMAFNSAVYAHLVKLKTLLVSANMDVWEHPKCLINLKFDDWLKGNAACISVVRHALTVAGRENSIKTVIIVFNYADAFLLDRQKLSALQAALRSLHKNIVYVLDVPIFSAPPTACKPRVIDIFGLKLTHQAQTACRQERVDFELLNGGTKHYLDTLKGNDPHIAIYDPLPAFCDAKYCYESDRRGVLYWMVAHVNERGSARMLSYFLPWLKSTWPTPDS